MKTLRLLLKPVYKLVLQISRIVLAVIKLLSFLVVGKTKDRYCIKSLYLSRKSNVHFNDTENMDEHQDGIYQYAFDLFTEKKLSSVLDIGCGSGYKLMKYFHDYNTTGLELSPALEFLKQKYPERSWIQSDFNNIPDGIYDMVLSVDVIEHLQTPEQLLKFISEVKCEYIIISTPDRSKMKLASKIGPPVNKAHIREWSRKEFVSFLFTHSYL